MPKGKIRSAALAKRQVRSKKVIQQPLVGPGVIIKKTSAIAKLIETREEIQNENGELLEKITTILQKITKLTVKKSKDKESKETEIKSELEHYYDSFKKSLIEEEQDYNTTPGEFKKILEHSKTDVTLVDKFQSCQESKIKAMKLLNEQLKQFMNTCNTELCLLTKNIAAKKITLSQLREKLSDRHKERIEIVARKNKACEELVRLFTQTALFATEEKEIAEIKISASKLQTFKHTMQAIEIQFDELVFEFDVQLQKFNQCHATPLPKSVVYSKLEITLQEFNICNSNQITGNKTLTKLLKDLSEIEENVIQQLKPMTEQATEELTAISSGATTLRQEYDKLTSHKISTCQQISQLNQEIVTMRQQLKQQTEAKKQESLFSDFDTLAASFHSQLDNLLNYFDNLKQATVITEQLLHVIPKSKSELAALQKDFEDLNSHLAQPVALLTQLTQIAKELREQVSLTATVTTISQDLLNSQSNLEKLLSEKHALDDDIHNLAEIAIALQQQLAVQEEIDTGDSIRTTFSEGADSVRQQILGLTLTCNNLQKLANLAEQQKSISALAADNNKLKESLETLTSSVELLNAKKAHLNERNMELRSRLAAKLSNRSRKLAKRFIGLQNKLKALPEESSALVASITILLSKLLQMQQLPECKEFFDTVELTNFKIQLAEFTNQFSTDTRTLQTKIKSAIELCYTLNKKHKLDKLQSDIKQLTSDLTTLPAHHSKLEDDYLQSLTTLNQELAAKEAKVITQSAQKAKLRSEIADYDYQTEIACELNFVTLAEIRNINSSGLRNCPAFFEQKGADEFLANIDFINTLETRQQCLQTTAKTLATEAKQLLAVSSTPESKTEVCLSQLEDFSTKYQEFSLQRDYHKNWLSEILAVFDKQRRDLGLDDKFYLFANKKWQAERLSFWQKSSAEVNRKVTVFDGVWVGSKLLDHLSKRLVF